MSYFYFITLWILFLSHLSLGAQNDNEKSREKFHEAISANNINEVQRLLTAGYSLKDEDVIEAVNMSSTSIVKYIMEHGGNAHAKDDSGHYLLYFAVSRGDWDLVNYLIQRGGLDDLENELNLEWLRVIIINKQKDIFEKIFRKKLQNKICLNIKEEFLYFSVLSDNIEIVQILLKLCPDMYKGRLTDMHKYIVLAAINGNNTEIIKLLLRSISDLNSLDVDPGFLNAAVSYRNIEVIKLLIKNGVNVSKKDMKGQTPLYNAVKNNDTDIVGLLLREAKLDGISDQEYNDLIHQALLNNNSKVVTMLISHKFKLTV